MKFIENRFLIISLVIVVIGAVWLMSKQPKSTGSSTKQQNSVALSSAFSKGSDKAPVKIIQYSDFLCPSCTQVSLGVMPTIIQNYVNTGKAELEFKPLAFVAAGSEMAAEGAFCAADQQKFWQYHDIAYATVWEQYFSKNIQPSQVTLYSQAGVDAIGQAAGVNTTQFDNCIANHSDAKRVQALTAAAEANGVNSTPYITINGVPVQGSPTYQVISDTIKAAL